MNRIARSVLAAIAAGSIALTTGCDSDNSKSSKGSDKSKTSSTSRPSDSSDNDEQDDAASVSPPKPEVTNPSDALLNACDLATAKQVSHAISPKNVIKTGEEGPQGKDHTNCNFGTNNPGDVTSLVSINVMPDTNSGEVAADGHVMLTSEVMKNTTEQSSGTTSLCAKTEINAYDRVSLDRSCTVIPMAPFGAGLDNVPNNGDDPNTAPSSPHVDSAWMGKYTTADFVNFTMVTAQRPGKPSMIIRLSIQGGDTRAILELSKVVANNVHGELGNR